MAYTLLQMVQRVAEFINAGAVNSISDTRESEQIATIIKETYEDLIVTKQIQAKNRLFKIEPLSDPSKPVYFRVQSPIIRLDYLKYYCENVWKTLDYIEPEEFMEKSLALKSHRRGESWQDFPEENVEVVEDFSGVKFYINNDKDPEYYTSFDDKHIVCNSYNKTVEASLQADKVSCKGVLMPTFEFKNDFVPEIAEQHFPLLLSASKLNADMELKNNFNQLEGNRSQKQAAITDMISKTNRAQGNALWMNRLKTGRL